MTETKKTEAGEQKAVIEWCRLSGINVVHIPNEGKRSYKTAADLNAMGMQKGFPDLFFPYARFMWHGLFIEMKRDSKSRVTKEQKRWILTLSDEGYFACVCRGADEAIKTIEGYMAMPAMKPGESQP